MLWCFVDYLYFCMRLCIYAGVVNMKVAVIAETNKCLNLSRRYLKTKPDSLSELRDYRGFRCKIRHLI